MSETNRRFWQLHLSTATLLMIVTSGLLYVNLTPIVNDWPNYGYAIIDHGFPIKCYYEVFGIQNDGLRIRELHWYDNGGLKSDCVVGFLSLVLTFVLCEGYIRRREARRQ